MKQYLDLLQKVLSEGELHQDRTGTGTLSIFGHKMEFDMRDGGFPILSTKYIPFKTLTTELIWMLQGKSNIDYLHKHNVHIWDEWANEDGDLGPVYGTQWRHWQCAEGAQIDQIKKVVKSIINDPYSRRHIVSAWAVHELGLMALPPCHVLFQFYVSYDNTLSLQVYQRSADVFLGLPFDIAEYALLLHIIAKITGYSVGKLIYITGDTHLYLNHINQAREQLKRAIPSGANRVQLELPEYIQYDALNFEDYQPEDFKLYNYYPQPHIKADVSV